MDLPENGKIQPSSKLEFDRQSELQAFDDTKAGVKGLVDAGLENVPRIFINEQYLSEKGSISSGSSRLSVPVIDVECLSKNVDECSRCGIIDKVKYACEEWGFFLIVNHGVPMSLSDEALEGVKKFHELDAQVKKQYYSRDWTKKVVYNSNFDLHQAPSANWRDTLYLIMAPEPPEPEEMPEVCRDIMLEYSKHIKKLGDDLFELISAALGLKPHHLKDMDCGKGLYVSGHYYPSCPQSDKTLGISSHTDSSFMTLLLQDQVGGLQVLHKNQWIDVPFLPGSLVVNIGDLMELITNARFKSVYHRVLANNIGPRISIAFFFRMQLQGGNNRMYGPIKELLSEANPPIYREALGVEILTCRFTKGLNGIPLLSYFKLDIHEAP